jgi:hypothetical protein
LCFPQLLLQFPAGLVKLLDHPASRLQPREPSALLLLLLLSRRQHRTLLLQLPPLAAATSPAAAVAAGSVGIFAVAAVSTAAVRAAVAAVIAQHRLLQLQQRLRGSSCSGRRRCRCCVRCLGCCLKPPTQLACILPFMLQHLEHTFQLLCCCLGHLYSTE